MRLTFHHVREKGTGAHWHGWLRCIFILILKSRDCVLEV
jgi:hypothetical protein